VHIIGTDDQAASGYGYADGTSDAAAFVSGTMAVVRAKFPAESPRRIVARVLYTARQFQGGQHTRNSSFGYGVALASKAMAAGVPANAPNPVYDAVGLTASNPSGSAAPSSSTAPSKGTAPASSAPAGGASSPTGTAGSGSSSSGLSTGALVGIIAAVLVVLVVVMLLVVRGRRRPARGGPPSAYAQGPPGPPGQWPQGP
jgi:subtilisin family serine protease